MSWIIALYHSLETNWVALQKVVKLLCRIIPVFERNLMHSSDITNKIMVT